MLSEALVAPLKCKYRINQMLSEALVAPLKCN